MAAAIPTSVRLPDSPGGRAFPAFLEAYNSGRFDRLVQFAREHADPRGDGPTPEGFARYWMGIHHEFGPVVLTAVDDSREPHYFWVRGQISCAWSAFVVHLLEGSPSLLDWWGVARGIRPEGLETARPVTVDMLPDVLDGYLERVAGADLFSGTVAVARDGKMLFERAYGLADHRHGAANGTDTRHVVASVTKMLTAVAVLQLVEDGVLALSDTLGRHVPEYPERIGSRVTVRHLLTHGSGIELDDWPAYNADVREARTPEEILRVHLRHLEHLNQGPVDEFELADGFDYTNEGFDLLGLIVERASGQSWEGYVREHVLAPAGMSRTGFHRDVAIAGLATGYTLGSAHPEGLRQENHALLPRYTRPSGGVFATAGDLVRFLDAVRTGVLLDPETALQATSPKVPWTDVGTGLRSSYGYGFEVGEVDGVRWFGHGGSLPGVGARTRVYADLGYTVAVLSNYDNAARIVMERIHDLITGQGGDPATDAWCSGEIDS